MRRVTVHKVCLSLVKEKVEPYESTTIRSGYDVAKLVKHFIGADPREHFVAVYLNAQNKVSGIHTVSIGRSDGTPVHPREVFQPAFLMGSSSIIVAHNHPTGDARPSVEDRSITKRLRQAGELLGITVLDHVVIGEDHFYSFAHDAHESYDKWE